MDDANFGGSALDSDGVALHVVRLDEVSEGYAVSRTPEVCIEGQSSVLKRQVGVVTTWWTKLISLTAMARRFFRFLGWRVWPPI